ncbi:TIGR04083 family peptide-modifying radical SAM enzyme [Methanotrichaceae archaeon M04Ac]|uniref:TIGR04083 family peptide-modifying radical SAM enzyme n=2 Tax=Candidatus Methanocrinis alkalitolerans TaxID=3033395 RepID=A0ABT5XC96_9EURY|nr:TIGR04083 family peptide-modifying radical SAM enzyme [Candidatus Methanocrinis alkalitolerans]MCR3884446.1 TIGR04083 family peptide-modifying radical SAM enzyme [Methanothrix sp.]MDF0592266.1 TIGR04083 family peptide-modifying radical SAM enzyme [Candidatus Methanocrinis alkalitolerans]
MAHKKPFHVMIIPTLGCPSSCSYCWSSDERSPIMTMETVKEMVEWLQTFRDDPITFTFHGGEPLLAGPDFYREALSLITEGLRPRKIAFALQTNLWKMTPEMAQVLAEYRVPIGSSLDGPKDLNDLQRSAGYFDKTMAGYEIARAHGLSVQFICTFTSYSIDFKEDIFNFFLENGLTLKLHPALPSIKSDDPDQWALAPVKYGDLLVYLLDRYLENMDDIEVRNINDLCRCVFTGRGTVCTYVDCMEDTFAVGPNGTIYPCYRFVGMEEWAMGNVRDRPTVADLAGSEAGKRMRAFKDMVDRECKSCRHIRYCRGGCPYNAIAPSGGELLGVDPHCIAYKRIFDEIADRFNKEIFGSMGMGSACLSSGPSEGAKPGMMALIQKIISS